MKIKELLESVDDLKSWLILINKGMNMIASEISNAERKYQNVPSQINANHLIEVIEKSQDEIVNIINDSRWEEVTGDQRQFITQVKDEYLEFHEELTQRLSEF